MFGGRRSSLWVLAALLLLVVSCTQQKAVAPSVPVSVGLEEPGEPERKAPVRRTARRFVPPARTIEDVVTAIGRAKKGNLKSLTNARSIFGRKTPKTKSSRTLTKFYLQRADAARQLGQPQDVIASYRLAVREFDKISTVSSQKVETIFYLGLAETQVGHHARGLDLVRKAVDLQGKKPLELEWSAILARVTAETGDLVAADEALRRAEALFAESKGWKRVKRQDRMRWKAELTAAQGRLLDLKGSPKEAEPSLREAASLYRNYKKWPRRSRADWKRREATYRQFLSYRMDNFRRLGRPVEAEAEARKIVLHTLRAEGRYSFEAVSSVQTLIQNLFDQGRYAEAEKLARLNLKTLQKIDRPSRTSISKEAKQELADALAAQRRWHEALAHYQALGEELEDDPASYQKHLAGNMSFAMALIVTERPRQAIEVLRVARERSLLLYGEGHFETAMIGGALGSAYARAGTRQRANLEFGRAIPLLMQRGVDAGEGSQYLAVREPWLNLVMESFIQFLSRVFQTPLDKGGGKEVSEQAFRLANFIRNLGLQRAIQTAASAAEKDPRLAKLADRKLSAQRQIISLTGLLQNAIGAPADQQNPFVIETLRKKIARLRASRSRVTRQIAKRFPAYDRLVHLRPETLRQARKSLRPGEALVSIYMGQERIYLWAIPKKGRAAFSAKAPGRWQIEPAAEQLRRSLHTNAKTIDDLPRFNVELGYELYKALLAPVHRGWKRARSLYIVAHGSVGNLPFAALPTKSVKVNPGKGPLFSEYKKVPWLVKRTAVTMLPSVASLKDLRAKQRRKSARRAFIGFGDPFFNARARRVDQKKKSARSRGKSKSEDKGLTLAWRGNTATRERHSARLVELSHLPETRGEVRSVAKAVRADLSRDVYLGKQATEDMLKGADLRNRKVVFFATHGLLPGDLNGLTQPALALSSQRGSGAEGDGLLTMQEVLGLRMNADWVVLPAFGDSDGKISNVEALTSLERAFFYAGARTLLRNTWPVETTSARYLMTDLFRRQIRNPRRSRASALRRSMLSMIKGKGYVDPATHKTAYSYAHPIFWAPFTLIGDGSGTSARAIAKK